jgi:uncharacterized membrane protein
MNLDLLPFGWVHFAASLAALAVGMLVLLRPKGTPVHKRGGRVSRTGWRSRPLS